MKKFSSNLSNFIKKNTWLIKYYIYNAIFFKLPVLFFKSEVKKTSNKWHELKLKKKSDQMLVVGNGPSLRTSDLELLRNMTSIASNKIYLLFDGTSWRPDLFTICDTLLAYKLRNTTFPVNCEVLCPDYLWPSIRRKNKQCLPWKSVKLDKCHLSEEYTPDPISSGLYEGYTITIQNICIAIWLGAKKIYLIGIDHNYEERQAQKAGEKFSHEVNNHFHVEYRKKGEIVNNAPIEKMNDAYMMTFDLAKSLGVEIINISRNSKLKIFPTKSLKEILTEMME